MTRSQIAAEVTPLPGKANEAARALQRLGFRVLHVGITISIEAGEDLWGSCFHIAFAERTKRVLPDIKESTVAFRAPTTEIQEIPEPLRGLVEDVAIVEPPELY